MSLLHFEINRHTYHEAPPRCGAVGCMCLIGFARLIDGCATWCATGVHVNSSKKFFSSGMQVQVLECCAGQPVPLSAQ